ncbi:MAG: hypothetical protein IKI55_03110 [Bacilli bacterium]|nr:hypothetical protein [Bacilli bacterium]
MKKIKEEEVQSEQSELEQATEEPKEIEKMEEAKEASKPAAEEAEPKKEKKGMPRFVKFLLFELLTIVIALGAHFCLLQFVAPILDLNELIEWIIATCASFVLYLVAGYFFNHLIVWKGKGKATFPKFLLSAFLGLVHLLALIHLGIFLTKIIVPTNPLHYSLTALSINHVLAHGGKSTPSGLGILGIALIAMILYSFLIRAFFVFKGEKALKKEEAEEVVEEKKEGEILTHASFRQIVQEELDKFFTSKKKFVRYSQAHSYIDEGIEEYEKKHSKKEEE